jgi:hypothetical protein
MTYANAALNHHVGLGFLVATVIFADPTLGAETAAPVPDFSGVWAREFIGFDPPASGRGHGPIYNLSRVLSGQANINVPVGDYNDPILKPDAAEIIKKRGEISLSGENFPQPANQCRPQPTPYVLWQQKIEFAQKKDEVLILYQFDHHIRHVRLNANHPVKITPSWSGDSVGHYEGETLVIDTIGVKTGPLSVVDRLGTPQSEAVHVVERYRLIDYEAALEATKIAERENIHLTPERPISDGVGIDPDYRGKALQVEWTVEDRNVVTMPWSASSTYRKSAVPLEERVCAETLHVYHGHDPDVPTANRPDF